MACQGHFIKAYPMPRHLIGSTIILVLLSDSTCVNLSVPTTCTPGPSLLFLQVQAQTRRASSCYCYHRDPHPCIAVIKLIPNRPLLTSADKNNIRPAGRLTATLRAYYLDPTCNQPSLPSVRSPPFRTISVELNACKIHCHDTARAGT